AFDSWAGLPLAVDDVEPHTTKGSRGQSRSARRPSRDTPGAARAPARRVWSPIAEASGSAPPAGSLRFPAQQAELVRNLNTIKSRCEDTTRRAQRGDAGGAGLRSPAGCRLASESLRAAGSRLGQLPAMIARNVSIEAPA